MALIDLLPAFYKPSNEVIELQEAFENQVEAIEAAKEDLFNQFDVQTATWGLEHWESAYGLNVEISRPYEFRRSRIISKMRGQGTTTKTMIKNVAESFSNGQVEVIEHNNNYYFEVKFVGTLGLPRNMDDLTSAIEEIKPAHLDYIYTYIYRMHSQLKSYTHDYLSGFTHQDLREEEL